MITRRAIFSLSAFCLIGLLAAPNSLAAVTVDRDYKMGDDAAEGAVAGNPVSSTFDSAGQPGQNQLVDLTGVNTPTYVTITGRPDNGTGKGIQFNAAQSEYLHGFNLGFPEDSFSAATHTTVSGGTLDYRGISNRGMQFWVRPTSTAVQSIVMDTNQHGVRINSNGKFSMRYRGFDYESSKTVVPNTWYHIEVVRPSGAANGSRMYINGEAVAAAAGGYDDDWSDLVVGANTAGDDGGTHDGFPPTSGFTGGNQEFFSGIVDDLSLFVLGTSTSTTPTNYGTFSFATDNAFASSPLTGIKGTAAGDVNNNGVFDAGDKSAFLSGWMTKRIVNGFQIGDLVSRGQGDLNLDGITNIQDLVLIQSALAGAGMGAVTADELAGVPEPTSALLALVATIPFAFRRRRNS